MQPVVALLELHGHGFDGDDGIIDQQAERKDERTQRYLVQTDVEQIHAERGRRQYQRDRNDHHHSGAKPETDQADHQHDADRFGDSLDEVVDRMPDRAGHACHLHQLESGGKRGSQARGLRFELLAERDDVARRRHRDADPENGSAAEAHVFARRIRVSALDVCDVAEADHAAVHSNQCICQLGDILELTARPNEDPVVGGCEQPGPGHRILRIDRIGNLLRRQAELRQLRIGDLDIDALLLVGDEVDLVDVRHAQQLGAQSFGVVMQLRGRKAVPLQSIEVGIDIAELVVEVRSLNSRRQGIGDVAHFLANLVPRVRNLRRRRRILDGEEQRRLPRP